MRISDWSSDVCSSDLFAAICRAVGIPGFDGSATAARVPAAGPPASQVAWTSATRAQIASGNIERGAAIATEVCAACHGENGIGIDPSFPNLAHQSRSEEHTSELQSLMRNSYAVFCLK